jgi:hypothetical protein
MTVTYSAIRYKIHTIWWMGVVCGPRDNINRVLVLYNTVAPEGNNLVEKPWLLHTKGGAFHDNVSSHTAYIRT